MAHRLLTGDPRARLAAELDDTQAWVEDMAEAGEDFLALARDTDPQDAAAMEWLERFAGHIDRRRQWIYGRMRRHERDAHRVLGAMAASRAHTAGFRTAGLRPRRACSASGRPAARRASSPRAGPDPDPDEPEPPLGGSTDVRLAVVA